MVSLDLENVEVTLLVQGVEGETDYDIEMIRIDDRGEESFAHSDVATRAGSVVHIAYGKWKGDGTPVTIGVDDGGDGDIDSTSDLDDQ